VIQRVRKAIQNAASQHWPAVAAWLGERPEYLASAYGVSLVLHLLLLAAFVIGGIWLGREGSKVIEAAIVDTSLPDLERVEPTELIETDREATLEPVLARTAPRFSPRIVENVIEPDPDLVVDPLALNPAVLLPASTTLSSRVQLRGDGAEHIDGVEKAVDRLALEILRHLEEGRVLVTWAFDASGSLQSERERLAGHIERVYENVLERPEAEKAAEEGLLTMVVAFGQDRKAMLEEPTNDLSAIGSAIRSVPLDKTGVESTFQTTLEIARRYGAFRKNDETYQTMLILVTDEAGDDEEEGLEAAIAQAKAAEMPVYVLGSSAPFGRKRGFMDYTDPESGRYYRRLPVDQGPESAELEMIRLPFWYGGGQLENLDSGFGPYGLSRLAGASGGIYFITRMGGDRPQFDPAGMREYRPDWVSRARYHQAVGRSPLRSAVLAAARITRRNLPGQPAMTFPAAGTEAFKEAMTRNQAIVAQVAYTVDEALGPILAASEHRDTETSRRWQAHYDLIKARLLAVKVRCFEYNWANAQMKTEPREFENERSNAWRLVPDSEIHYSASARKAGEEAEHLLKKVLQDHPGTPWALLAQRELRAPFGFKWVEIRVPPPRRNNGGGNNARPPRNRSEGEANASPPKL